MPFLLNWIMILMMLLSTWMNGYQNPIVHVQRMLLPPWPLCASQPTCTAMGAPRIILQPPLTAMEVFLMIPCPKMCIHVQEEKSNPFPPATIHQNRVPLTGTKSLVTRSAPTWWSSNSTWKSICIVSSIASSRSVHLASPRTKRNALSHQPLHLYALMNTR